MRRFRKRFKRPKRPYDSQQISEGKELKKKFGLRRKKEIWIAQEIVRKFRQRTRELIAVKNREEEKVLLERLAQLGLLQGGQLDDVLGLTLENVLERRLQTLVFRKGYTKTISQARQAIVHGQVRVSGRKMVFPSYLVKSGEEAGIECSFKLPVDTGGKRGVVQAGEQQEAAAPEEAQESKAQGPEAVEGAA